MQPRVSWQQQSSRLGGKGAKAKLSSQWPPINDLLSAKGDIYKGCAFVVTMEKNDGV